MIAGFGELFAALRHRPSGAEILSRRLGRSALLATASMAVQGGMRTLFGLLAARILSVQDYGDFATGLAVATGLTILWPASAGAALSKYIARAHGVSNPDRAVRALRHLSGRTLQASLVVGPSAAVIFWVLSRGSLPAAAWFGLVAVGLSGQFLCRGLHFGVNAVAREAVIGGIGSVVSVLALGLVVLKPSVGSAAAAFCSGLIVYLFLAYPWVSPRRAPQAERREIDQFVMIAALGSVASAGFLQMSVVVSRLLLGSAATAQYALAVTLATPLQLFASALGLVLQPALASSDAADDRLGVGAKVVLSTRILLGGLVPTVCLGILLTPKVLPLLVGNRYPGTERAIPWLLIAVAISSIAAPSVAALSAGHNRGIRFAMIFSFVGSFFGAALWGLYGSFGVTWIASGYVIGCLVTAGAIVARVARLYSIRWHRTFAVAGSAVILAQLISTRLGDNLVLALFSCGALVAVWGLLDPLTWRSALRACNGLRLQKVEAPSGRLS